MTDKQMRKDIALQLGKKWRLEEMVESKYSTSSLLITLKTGKANQPKMFNSKLTNWNVKVFHEDGGAKFILRSGRWSMELTKEEAIAIVGLDEVTKYLDSYSKRESEIAIYELFEYVKEERRRKKWDGGRHGIHSIPVSTVDANILKEVM